MAGIVRRPDPVPCPNCAVGEWDMCRNGQYTERGIKEIDGFMSERWRVEPEYVVKIDPSLGMLGVLLEPTTVVAKAWEQVRMVGQRAFWEPRTVAHHRRRADRPAGGADRQAVGARSPCPRPGRIGSQAGHRPCPRGHLPRRQPSRVLASSPTSIIECTGVGQVIIDSIQTVAPGGVVCLTGVGSGGNTVSLPAADTASNVVLRNNVVVGSVNANKRHWYKAAQLLSRTDHAWLARLVTRREPRGRIQASARTAAG